MIPKSMVWTAALQTVAAGRLLASLRAHWLWWLWLIACPASHLVVWVVIASVLEQMTGNKYALNEDARICRDTDMWSCARKKSKNLPHTDPKQFMEMLWYCFSLSSCRTEQTHADPWASSCRTHPPSKSVSDPQYWSSKSGVLTCVGKSHKLVLVVSSPGETDFYSSLTGLLWSGKCSHVSCLEYEYCIFAKTL